MLLCLIKLGCLKAMLQAKLLLQWWNKSLRGSLCHQLAYANQR
jgi:hypothetical protein